MNNKTYLKLLIVVASMLLVGLSFANYVQKVQAENLTAGPLTISYPGVGSLFSQMNISPGDDFQKTITVTNNGTISHSFAIATKNVTGDLAQKLQIQPYVLGSQVWSASIADLAVVPTESKVILSNIAPGNTQTVDLKAVLDSSLDNNYQEESVKFDLVFGSEEAEPTPTSTLTSTSTVTSTSTATATSADAGLPALTGGGTIATALRTFAFNAVSTTQTVTPTASPSISASSTATVAGEVKGEQTGGGVIGEEWRLLLIVPIVGILSTFLIGSRLWRAIIIPPISGIGVFVLSYFFNGTLETWIFYLILVLEVVALMILEYYINRGKQRASKAEDS